MLQNNDEQKKSKLEQISIISKRDADQKPFRLCVPRSCFLSELTWIEEDKTFDLFVQHKLHAVEPTVTYEPSQVIQA
ncbi:unnamed protein product [Adineta steineri]|uniref:Uncharacterized protein n=1 Tax=Adineta steineri TaxID=433720 RepID=A0A816AWK1_9BILA|nr:unnamed protein product [Adineta steineri]CAF1601027.1 unnamed protein product [Adineta steineri]